MASARIPQNVFHEAQASLNRFIYTKSRNGNKNALPFSQNFLDKISHSSQDLHTIF